jgi:single stranded DNA-binding protein
MLNQLILTGNLGNDPEIFFGSEGDPVTSFSLAFKSGREKTGWLKCVCFNKNAEIASTYLHPGARIAVVGRIGLERVRDALESLAMAGATRLELATSGVTGRRSNQTELRPRK